MLGRRCRSNRGEQGQILIMSVLFMTVLIGAAAMALDVGRMAVTRRSLQNGVDAAALAGAFRLPTEPGGAESDAVTWAANNQLIGAEVTEAAVFRSNFANDTIRVSAERPVPYIFGRVLGLDSHTLTATATAQISLMNGITAGRTRAFPYAVWGGNKQGVKMGDRVVFRSNAYEQVNVNDDVNCNKGGKTPPPGCTWDVDGNNFKGYFHWENGAKYYVDPDPQAFSQGGNAFGTNDATDLWVHYQSGVPIILPVIDWAENPTGQRLDFVIPAFVCVKITQLDQTGSVDWAGTIVQCAGDGLNDGSTPPSLNSSFTIKLVQ
jgi:Flp pilus assembly protein TadG